MQTSKEIIKKLFNYLDWFTFLDNSEIAGAILDFIDKNDWCTSYIDFILADDLANDYIKLKKLNFDYIIL